MHMILKKTVNKNKRFVIFCKLYSDLDNINFFNGKKNSITGSLKS